MINFNFWKTTLKTIPRIAWRVREVGIKLGTESWDMGQQSWRERPTLRKQRGVKKQRVQKMSLIKMDWQMWGVWQKGQGKTNLGLLVTQLGARGIPKMWKAQSMGMRVHITNTGGSAEYEVLSRQPDRQGSLVGRQPRDQKICVETETWNLLRRSESWRD